MESYFVGSRLAALHSELRLIRRDPTKVLTQIAFILHSWPIQFSEFTWWNRIRLDVGSWSSIDWIQLLVARRIWLCSSRWNVRDSHRFDCHVRSRAIEIQNRPSRFDGRFKLPALPRISALRLKMSAMDVSARFTKQNQTLTRFGKLKQQAASGGSVAPFFGHLEVLVNKAWRFDVLHRACLQCVDSAFAQVRPKDSFSQTSSDLSRFFTEFFWRGNTIASNLKPLFL